MKEDMMILLGFHRQCITPKLPARLSGYAGERIANNVHDDLYTRCIAMECGGSRFLLAQCDCLAVDEALRKKVLSALADLNISEEHLILLATHTHSGPAGTIDTSEKPFQSLQYIFGAPNPEYQSELAEKIALAAHLAFSDMLECKLTIGRGTIENVGTERHDPKLPGDPSLLTLLFERTDGKKVLLYNYACHLTVLNPANLFMTADLSYAVERGLNYDMVMFVNSNAGDISTRFTRISSSFKQAEAYGKIIADSIEKSLAAPVYKGPFETIGITQYPITLPVKKVRPVEDEVAQLKKYENQLAEGKKQGLSDKQLRILASYVEGAKTAVDLAASLKGLENIKTHFSIMTLQNLKIAVIPGELFSTLGVSLKKDNIEVFGYGNGYYLYLADKSAYDNQYYEAMSSPFERGVGEYLIEEIRNKVHRTS